MTKVRENECLCGARERDEGQQRPRKCWACGKADGMGEYPRTSMIGAGGFYWEVLG